MASQLQLFAGGEDAQLGKSAFVGRLLHEDGFGEVHLARDGLHLVVRKAVAVGENGERIAFETRISEDVESVEAMFHWIVSRAGAGTKIKCARAGRLSFRWRCFPC